MNQYNYSYKTPVIRPRKTRGARVVAWLLCLLLLGYVGIRYVEPYVQNAAATSVSKVHAASIKSARQKAIAALPAQLSAITAQYSGVTFSVSIVDLQTGATQHVGSSQAFDAASTGKLITAADILYLIEQGQYTLDTYVQGHTIQDWLQALIINSDDTAWTVLNTQLTHSQMSQYAQTIGVTSYDPSANTVTTNDIATLLQKLYGGKLLNQAHTNLLLSYMQQANYQGYIVAAAPATATVYHKIGVDDGELNDAAIIVDGSHKYVLVVDSNSNNNDEAYDVIADTARTEAFAAITKAVTAAYGTN